jgi:DNA-binding IclR family transcriptional regulator
VEEKLATAKQNSDRASEGKDTKSLGSYSAPALEKGLDILEMLCNSESGLSQKEIAARLGRSVSELYRMLNCLQRRDYVANYNDRYAITTKLFQMSQMHPPTRRLLVEAMPIMQELARRVSFSCHLTVYSRGAQTVIAAVETPSGIGFSARVGSEIEIAPSASGRVLIAFQDAETMELRTKESLEGRSQAEIKLFQKELHEVAVKGFSSIKSRQYEGLHAISFPVLDINRNAIAALTVPILPRVDVARQAGQSEVEDALRDAANRLTSRIR